MTARWSRADLSEWQMPGTDGDARKAAQRRAGGRRAKRAGQSWEDELEALHARYSAQGLAEVWRSPESIRRVSEPDHKGSFRAIATGKGPADFVGTFGPRGIAFEAKSTSEARWPFKALLGKDDSTHQAEALDRFAAQGGLAFIALRMTHGQVTRWMVPWARLAPRWWGWYEWRQRGEVAASGTASLSLTDLGEIALPFEAGGWADVIDELGAL